jgi:hypothetical protein
MFGCHKSSYECKDSGFFKSWYCFTVKDTFNVVRDITKNWEKKSHLENNASGNCCNNRKENITIYNNVITKLKIKFFTKPYKGNELYL